MSSMQDELRCNVCLRQFDRPSRLHAHYQTHTGERPFNCLYCDKSFASKGNCNTHMRVHTREKPYGCPHCEKKFSQHGQLVIHKRTHTGEKPYVCTECNKGFTCSKVLKIHTRTHTGEKPFTCDYCPKTFAAYANLVVHRRIHTRERPYSCRLCARAFEHSGNLARHVRGHQVPNGIRCIPCGQVFQEESELMAHTVNEHPSDRDEDEESEVAQSETSNPSEMSSISVVSHLHSPDVEEGTLENASMTVEISESSGVSSELSTIDTNALELTAVTNLNFGVHEVLENQTDLRVNEIHMAYSENNNKEYTAEPMQEEHHESLQNNYEGETNQPVIKNFTSGTIPTKRKSNSTHTKIKSKKSNNRNLISLPNLVQEYDRTQNDLGTHHARCSPNLSSSVTQMTLVDIETLPDIPENVQMISPTVTNISFEHNNSADHGILLDLSSTSATVLSDTPLNLTNSNINGSSPTVNSSLLSAPNHLQSHLPHEETVPQVVPSTNVGKAQNTSTKKKGKVKKAAVVTKPRKLPKKTNPPDLIPLDQHESNKKPIKTITDEIVIDDDDEIESSPNKQFRLTNSLDCRNNRYPEINSYKTKIDSKDELQKRLNVKNFHDGSLLLPNSDHHPQRTQKYNLGGNVTENVEPAVRITNELLSNRTDLERRFPPNSSGGINNINVIGAPRPQAPSQNSRFLRPISPVPPIPQVGRYQNVGARSCPSPFVSEGLAGSNQGEKFPMSLDTLRAQIKRSVMSMVPNGAQVRDEFKHKAESAMLFLLGEESMRQLGFPHKNIEQVLISILDGAGMQSCSDVRVDEARRLKYNLRMLLEYSFPDPVDWDQFNWSHQPIESIVDTIASWRERGQPTQGFRTSSAGGLNLHIVNGGQLAPEPNNVTSIARRRYEEGSAETIGNGLTGVIRRAPEPSSHGGHEILERTSSTRCPVEFVCSEVNDNTRTPGNHQVMNKAANSGAQAHGRTTRGPELTSTNRLPSLFQGGIRNLLGSKGLGHSGVVDNNRTGGSAMPPNTMNEGQANLGVPTGEYRYYSDGALTTSR